MFFQQQQQRPKKKCENWEILSERERATRATRARERVDTRKIAYISNKMQKICFSNRSDVDVAVNFQWQHDKCWWQTTDAMANILSRLQSQKFSVFTCSPFCFSSIFQVFGMRTTDGYYNIQLPWNSVVCVCVWQYFAQTNDNETLPHDTMCRLLHHTSGWFSRLLCLCVLAFVLFDMLRIWMHSFLPPIRINYTRVSILNITEGIWSGHQELNTNRISREHWASSSLSCTRTPVIEHVS